LEDCNQRPRPSPDHQVSTGTIYIKRDLLLTLANRSEQSGEDEAPANMAGWVYEDGSGGPSSLPNIRERNREMMAHSSADIEAANIKILYIVSPPFQETNCCSATFIC